MKISIPSVTLIIIFASLACKHQPTEKDAFVPIFSTYKAPSPGTDTAVVTKQETNYGILTPVEISVIFNRLGLPYNNATLNPTSNRDLYLSSAKAALATGIYGVDFAYLKMFGIGQEVIDYMVTIIEMSNKLGIPDGLLLEHIRKVQNDLADPDSVTFLMKRAYRDIDNNLRLSGRESTAGLMVMSGWVEAMYIATQLVYNPLNPDPEIVQKIAEQKYALTSLLSFLKNYYDDPVVVYYTKKLKYLKNYFDSFEIYFEPGDLEIDTTKQVLRSSGVKMTVTVGTLNNIRDYIARLRTEMMTP